MDKQMKKLLEPVVIKTPKSNLIIGSVTGVNDKSSQEHSAEITEHEMSILCKEWASKVRGVEECWNLGQTGSYEIRMYPYANDRLSYFEKFLGIGVVNYLFATQFEGFQGFKLSKKCTHDCLKCPVKCRMKKNLKGRKDIENKVKK